MRKNMSLNWLKAVGVLAVVGILAGVFIIPAYASVDAGYYESANQVINDGGVERFFKGALVRTFRYQIGMTEFIGHSLINAGSSVVKAGARIKELINEGKDAVILQDAVAEFEKLIEEADDAYKAAQNFVDLLRGFDEKGDVINLVDARETIKAIEPHLKTARENIYEAVRIVYEAIQEFRLISDD